MQNGNFPADRLAVFDAAQYTGDDHNRYKDSFLIYIREQMRLKAVLHYKWKEAELMAQKKVSRKDSRGRVLRHGESQRSSDGRYIFTYTDDSGKRRYVYATDLTELRKREDFIRRNSLDGLRSWDAETIDLNQMFDRYIRTKTELRDSTRTNYEYMYDRYVRESFGKKKLGDIRYSDVLSFYQKLTADIRINTLEIVHNCIHPALQLAVRDNLIRNNPSDGVMGEMKRKSTSKPGIRHALTVEQQNAFTTFYRNSETYWSWGPILTVLLGTGCRVGEIIGLRWEDIDLDNRLISINHTITYRCRKRKAQKWDEEDVQLCSYKVNTTKTDAGIRTVPMMDPVYEAFKLQMQIEEVKGPCTAVIDGMSGFIFSNRYHTIHNPQAINRAIARIARDYNLEEKKKAEEEGREPLYLPHFSCHHLRHTFCSRLCENETNVKVIQAVMGHVDITTTMNIYAEVNESRKLESVQNLSRELNIF